MKQRVITGILFTVAILLFFVPGFFFPGFLVSLWILVCAIATFEMIRCVQAKNLRPGRFLCAVGAFLSVLPVILRPFLSTAVAAAAVYSLSALMLAMLSVIFLPLRRDGEDAFADGIATAGIFLYVSFPIACANITSLYFRSGWYFLAIGLITPWVSDVFAYFTGSLFGKHKIVPHISPKKTWEGCAGGVVGSMLITALFFFLFIQPLVGNKVGLPALLLFGAFTGGAMSVLSQLGDWMASAIKRWAGIKDFGKILPGHGGILDRFDSAFFTLPAAFALALILG